MQLPDRVDTIPATLIIPFGLDSAKVAVAVGRFLLSCSTADIEPSDQSSKQSFASRTTGNTAHRLPRKPLEAFTASFWVSLLVFPPPIACCCSIVVVRLFPRLLPALPQTCLPIWTNLDASSFPSADHYTTQDSSRLVTTAVSSLFTVPIAHRFQPMLTGKYSQRREEIDSNTTSNAIVQPSGFSSISDPRFT